MAKQSKHPSPKTIAVQDIRIELSKEGKCFIAFRTELNNVMKALTKEYLDNQKKIKQ